jgi:hypothetical protein
MPKYILERDGRSNRENPKGSDLESTFSSAKSKGEQVFQAKQEGSSESESGSSATESDFMDGGLESLEQAGIIDMVYNGLELKNKKFPESYEMCIYESMDDFYRRGEFTIFDRAGFLEYSSIYNTEDGEHLEITLRNKFEGDNGRVIKFAMFGVKQEPIAKPASSSEVKKLSFRLFEEPFFTKHTQNMYNESYQESTGQQIIANLLVDKLGFDTIKYVEDDDNPIMSSFIIPGWSAAKTILYLKQYVSGGPLKVFPVSIGDDTALVVAPLSKLLVDELYSSNPVLVPSNSGKVDGAFRMLRYTLYGPTNRVLFSSTPGETVMTFDYFSGKEDDEKKPLYNFPETDKEKYAWDDGNEEYKLEKRTPASVIAGKYSEGLKKVNHLGEKLFFKKDLFENIEHSYVTDVEEKPLIERKMLSRFNEDNFKNGIMLYAVIPGSKLPNIGQIWDIQLPSVSQDSETSKPGNSNETISGKWILWKMKHVIGNKVNDGRVRYELHCWFLRTGLETSNKPKADSV